MLIVIYKPYSCFLDIKIFIEPVNFHVLVSTKFSQSIPNIEQIQRIQAFSIQVVCVSQQRLL